MSRPRKWSDELLRDAVKRCISQAEVLRALGIYVGGTNYETVKRRIKDLGLDTSHWLGAGHLKGKTHNWLPARPLADILHRGTRYQTARLKRRLLKAGLLKAVCGNCGLSEWMGKPIPLELDHIDGDRENNSLDNLQLICPNCHALTQTYRGKNTRHPHIPMLQDIQRGIEECGGIPQYALKIGVSRDRVRSWLKSERLRRLSKVEEPRRVYWH
jgi:5-methylcytosine-specific restriction endonuclease McrA